MVRRELAPLERHHLQNTAVLRIVPRSLLLYGFELDQDLISKGLNPRRTQATPRVDP